MQQADNFFGRQVNILTFFGIVLRFIFTFPVKMTAVSRKGPLKSTYHNLAFWIFLNFGLPNTF